MPISVARVLSVSTVSVLLHGCAVEPAPPPTGENVAVSRAAITATSFHSLVSNGNSGLPIDIGPTADRTCFLQGVSGEVAGYDGSGSSAIARVFQNVEGRWLLEAKAGKG